ncbi:MAG: ribosomal protein S18-alanine N-acetyltransferase [Bacillota bacterium]
MPVVIEPMTLDDLDAVAAIEAASFTQPWSRQSFYSELANNQLASYYVARLEGNVAGYGGVWVILDEAHVTTLAVDRRYRRRGIAGSLLERLIERSQALGALRMTLEVRPSNQPARSLYEKYGFSVQGIRKRYYFNEDGLIMFKEDLGQTGCIDEPAR